MYTGEFMLKRDQQLFNSIIVFALVLLSNTWSKGNSDKVF